MGHPHQLVRANPADSLDAECGIGKPHGGEVPFVLAADGPTHIGGMAGVATVADGGTFADGGNWVGCVVKQCDFHFFSPS